MYVPQPYGTVIPFDIVGMPAKLVAEILDAEYSVGTRAGSFCTYELLRRFKGISPEEDKRIAAEVKQGVTTSIPSIVRASFSIYNTLQDATTFVRAVEEISARGIEFYTSRYQCDPLRGHWQAV